MHEFRVRTGTPRPAPSGRAAANMMPDTHPPPCRPQPGPYRVLLFDCVNTLYLPDASGLPRVRVGEREVPSTAPLLLERLRPYFPGLDAETVHQAARAAWWSAATRRPKRRAGSRAIVSLRGESRILPGVL